MKWPNVATDAPALTYAVSAPPLARAWFVILLSLTLPKRTPAWVCHLFSEDWLRLLFLFFFSPWDNLQFYQHALRSRLESVRGSGADFSVKCVSVYFILTVLFVAPPHLFWGRETVTTGCPSDFCSSNHLPLWENISSFCTGRFATSLPPPPPPHHPLPPPSFSFLSCHIGNRTTSSQI